MPVLAYMAKRGQAPALSSNSMVAGHFAGQEIKLALSAAGTLLRPQLQEWGSHNTEQRKALGMPQLRL